MKDNLIQAIALLDKIMEEKPSRELADIVNKLEEMKAEL